MLTFISFILTMFGAVNWLLIGLLQYDFIAGLFGFQASIFSRLIYILFGIGAVYLAIRVIVNKGEFKVFERRKKKEEKTVAPAQSNVEASKESIPERKERDYHPEIHERDFYKDDRNDFAEKSYDDNKHFDEQDNIFDEHFRDLN